MAGIYIHIPFCKKICYYCDFFKSPQLKYKQDFLDALFIEIKRQKHYLYDKNIETIYFGGGTPSVLSKDDILQIFNSLNEHFEIRHVREITLEANPDDLTADYLKQLKNTPINRLSIGIQSFFDDDLKLMNRRHSAQQSIEAVKNAQNAGFENITGDLIYGLPNSTIEKWEKNLNHFFDLKIQHLSAYHLGIEPKTVFDNYLKKGKIAEIPEEESIEQFRILIQKASGKGFIQYEIANFGIPDFFSQHNSNYWKQKTYLGLGPSAHSFNKTTRHWNISNLKAYIELLKNGEPISETEMLDTDTTYNEFVMTRLRTMWGIDVNKIYHTFGEKYYHHFLKNCQKYIDSEDVISTKNIFILSDSGKFISDRIISDLFY